MSNGFEIIGQEQLDRNGNPVENVPTQETGFRILGGNPEAEQDLRIFKAAPMGVVDPDQFDFRLTPDIDPLEKRARMQTAGSKWLNATGKMGALTAMTALDNTLGTIVGLGTATAELLEGGGIRDAAHAFINNPVSTAIYDITKKAEEVMPNYYTRKEQHSPWYTNMTSSAGAANFWADTILKNTGFALGAYLSGMGISATMAKLTQGMTKKAMKNIAGRAAKKLPQSEEDIIKMIKAGEMPAADILGELSKDAAKLSRINTTNQLTASTLGAVGESRIEAISAYHDVYEKVRRENPNMPADKANEMAKAASNNLFMLDLVTLSMGNYAQFRNAFSRGYETNKRSMNAIQRSADDGIYKATGGRIQKARNVASIALNPMYEGAEEQVQFFNQNFSEKYMMLQNDPDARMSVDNMIQASMTAGAEALDPTNLDNFFAGMITGAMGMPGVKTEQGKTSFQWQGGIYEGVQDYKTSVKNTEQAISTLNEYMSDPDYQKRLAFLTKDASLEKIKNIALANEDLHNFKNSEDDQFLNMVTAFADAGKLEDFKNDIKGLGSLSAKDYRTMMSVEKDNLPKSLRDEMSAEQKTYDIFNDVNDSTIENMLSERSTAMLSQVESILKIRDDLEIKTGNKIDRSLVPTLVHYAYTIERGQKRLEDIKANVLSKLAESFTSPMQYEAPEEKYGYVYEKKDDLPTGVAGKKVLKILKETDAPLADADLTEEEKKAKKEKQKEADKKRKTLITSKREKADTEGKSLFNFSILETGDESMFLEAFENFAKENPFAAEQAREDVMDAVKMSRRIRRFVDNYTSVYTEGKLSEDTLMDIEKSEKRLKDFIREKLRKDFMPGTRVLYKDPKTKRETVYEVVKYEVKEGKRSYILKEYVEGVGKDSGSKKVVTEDALLDISNQKLYERIAGQPNLSRTTLDENEISVDKLETSSSDPKDRQVTYTTTKDGKQVKITKTRAEDTPGKKKGYKNLRGRAEKLLFRYFDVRNKDRLSKALDLINNLLPDNETVPVNAQLDKFATLFYNHDAKLGYLAQVYTEKGLEAVAERLYSIKNVSVRNALLDQIEVRRKAIIAMREKALNDYGGVIDMLYDDLLQTTSQEEKLSKEIKLTLENAKAAFKNISILNLDKDFKKAKTKLIKAINRFEQDVKNDNEYLAEASYAEVIKWENRIKEFEATIKKLESSAALLKKQYKEKKARLDKIKEDNKGLERVITKLEVERAKIDKKEGLYPLESFLKNLENTIPEEVFMEGLKERIYNLPEIGLTTAEKRDWLLRDEERPNEMSDELINAKTLSEKAQADLEKRVSIASASAVKIELENLNEQQRALINEDATRLGMSPTDLVFQLLTPNSMAVERADPKSKEVVTQVFGSKEQLLEKAPISAEEGKDIQALREKAEESRSKYLEMLNSEKPYQRADPDERKNNLISKLYKEQGIDNASPETTGQMSDPSKDATRPKMVQELKDAEKEEQKNLGKALEDLNIAIKNELEKDKNKRDPKLIASLKESLRVITEAKLKGKETKDFDKLSDKEVKDLYLTLMRRKLSGLKKSRENLMKVVTEKVAPKKKVRKFMTKEGSGPDKLGAKFETREETDEEFIDRVYEESYARRVEGLEALGVSIDDSISVSDIKTMKGVQDELIIESEKQLQELDSTIKMIDNLVKEMKALLERVNMGDTTIERSLPEKLKSAQSIKDFLFELEKEKTKLTYQIAGVSESLIKQRQQGVLMKEVMERAETKEVIDLIRNARAAIKKKTTPPPSSPTDTDTDTKGPDTPTTITEAGSTVSPGNVNDKDAENGTKESARPPMWESLSKSAGSDQPIVDGKASDNPIASQRRWYRWLEHNKDFVQDKAEVELFIPNANGYLVNDDDIEAVKEADRDKVIYMALITYDEKGKKQYVSADGKHTDTFNSDKSVYTSMPDPTTDNVKHREPVLSELRVRYGFQKDEGTSEVLLDLFNREKQALEASFQEKKDKWLASINSGTLPNPVFPVSGVSNGIPNEKRTNTPITAKEFFGTDDVIVKIATGESMTIGSRTVKVPKGYTVAIDKKTDRFVVLKPRNISEAEIETIVNIFQVYASRHMSNEDGTKIERQQDAAVIYNESNEAIDLNEANLFSVLNDMIWWQGNNYDKKGNIINTNQDTAFHFVKNSNIQGGELNIRGEVIPFILSDPETNRTFANPQAIEAIRGHLKINGYRQITSRRFNSKNKNKAYTHIQGIDSIGKATKVKRYTNYNDYIISDQSDNNNPTAGVFINKVQKPSTVEEYQDAEGMFFNNYITFNLGLVDESVKIKEERQKKAQSSAAKAQVLSVKKDNATPNIGIPDEVQTPSAPMSEEDLFNADVDSMLGAGLGQRIGGESTTPSTDTNVAPDPNEFNPGGARRAEPGKRYDRIEDPKKAEAWFKSKFPKSIEYKRVERMVNNGNFGNFHKGVVTVLNSAPEGTTYHEAFHVVMNHFLSKEEHASIIKEFESRKNAEKAIAEKAITYPDYTRVELIEEVIAEEFAEYQLSGGKKVIPSPKQKSFFQKLLDFIKGIFSSKTPSIQELYDSIENGYFRKAKASSNPMNPRLFNRKFNSASSPLTQEFSSVVDRKFFALAATEEFRQEFNAFIAGDASKSFVMNALYNKTRDELKTTLGNIKKYSENKSIPLNSRLPYIKSAENFEIFLQSWDLNTNYQKERDQVSNSFVQFHKKTSLSRHLDFKDVDFDSIKDEDSKDSGGNTWATNSMTVSPVNNSSKRLRLLLAGIPETKKGVTLTDFFGNRAGEAWKTTIKSDDFLGLPKAMPFGKAFSVYSKILSNTRTLQEAYDTITDPKTFENLPGAGILLQQLRLKEFLEAETLNNFTQSDIRLLSDFSAAFNLQRINPVIGIIGSDGNNKVVDALQETQKTQIKNQAITEEKLHATTTATYSSYDKNTEKIKYTGTVPTQSGEISLDKNPIKDGLSQMDMDMLLLYKGVGIEISEDTWKTLPKGLDAKTVNIENVNRIKNQMADKKISIHDKSSGFGPMLNEIYQEIIESNPDQSENSYLNLQNKRVYSNILNNFMSFMKNAINSVESLTELHQKYPHTNSEFFTNSKFLKLDGIYFDSNGDKRKGIKLEINISAGGRTDQGMIKKEYDKMGPGERFSHTLTMADNNSFLLVRTADNSNERFVSFGDNPLASTITTTEFIEDVKGYIADELMYIQEVRDLQEEGSNYKFSKLMESNENAILTSPVLRILADYGGLNDSLKSLLELNPSNESVKTFLEDNSEEISKAIKEYVEENTQSLIKRAIDLKLVNPIGDNFENFGIPIKNRDGNATGSFGRRTLESTMRRYAKQFFVASVEQHKLFAGHPAQFVKLDKDLNDFYVDNMIKRMSGMVGPKKASMIDSKWWAALEKLFPTQGGMGRLFSDSESNIFALSVSDNGTVQDNLNATTKPVLRTLVFKDIEARTEVEELINMFPGYDELNEADAQGAVHLDTYRDLLLANSLWDLSLEKLYRWEMNGNKPVTFTYDGQKIDLKTEADLKDGSGKMPSFNPLKPQYYGPLAEKGNIMSMYKLSIYPLIPSVIKGKKLEKLNAFMQSNTTGLVVFESGNKVGTKVDKFGEVKSLYNDEGDIDLPTNTFDGLEGEGQLPFQHIYYEFFGIQVGTGNTKKTSTAYGTQIHKQIMYEMQSGPDSYRPMSFDLPGMETADPNNTKKVLSTYNELVAARQLLAVNKLTNRLGIKYKNGSYLVENTDKTIKAIKDLLKDRDLPQEHIEALNYLKDQTGRIHPLGISLMPEKTSIERALFSIVDKETVKKNMKGAGLIQVAPTGWEEIKVNRTYKDGKLNAETLKFYMNKDGKVTRMQVYLPHYFKEILGDLKDTQITDPRLKELLGFRIPTSGLNSIDAIEIAGFLPAKAGDMIVLPSEIVNKAGSDYDVDKLTVYYPHYTIRKTEDGTLIPTYINYYTEEEIEKDPLKREELLKRSTSTILRENDKIAAKVNEIKKEFKSQYFDYIEKEKKNVVSDFMEVKSVQTFVEEFNTGSIDINGIKGALKGIKRTSNLLNAIKDKMSNMDLMDFMVSIEEFELLKTEDLALYSNNFNDLMDVSEALPVIDRIINTVKSFESLLEDEGIQLAQEESAKLDRLSREVKDEMNKKIQLELKDDIDLAFKYLPIENKNGIKAVENKLSALMQKIVLSPENYENLTEPIGSEILSSIANEIKDLKGKTKSIDNVTKLLDMNYMLDTVERFSEGKPGVGIGSLQSVNELLMQASNWEVNKDHKINFYNVLTGEYEKGFDPTIALENNSSIGEVPSFLGNNTVSGDVRSKLRILNNFINAYVDIAADPFIIDINAGIDMAPTIMTLLRAGVPIKTVFYFVNQPIIIDYMKKMKSDKNNLITSANEQTKSVKEIVDELYDSYSNERKIKPLQRVVFSDAELKEGLNPSVKKDENFYGLQLKALSEFMKYEALGGEVANILKNINYDTAGNGRGTSQIFARDLNSNLIKEVALFKGFDNMFSKGSYLAPFKDSVDKTPKVLRNLFPELNNALPAKFIMSQFEEYFKDINLKGDAQVNTIDRVLKEMLNHIAVTMRRKIPGSDGAFTDSLTQSINSLTVSNLKEKKYSAPKQLKTLLNNPKYSYLKKNPFIAKLQTVFNEKEGDRVIVRSHPKEKAEIDDMIMGWRELFTSNDASVRLVASRLAELSLVQSGIIGHPVGFTKYLPPEITADFLRNSFDQYMSMNYASKENYNNNILFDIFLNNIHNRDMINNSKSGRTPLAVKFNFKREWLNKTKQERQDAIDSGIFIWEPKILLRSKEKNMIIRKSGKTIKVPLIDFWKNYVNQRGNLALMPSSSNRADTLLLGGYTLKNRKNPIVDSLPIFNPIDNQLSGETKLKGVTQVKDNKDDNGNCN